MRNAICSILILTLTTLIGCVGADDAPQTSPSPAPTENSTARRGAVESSKDQIDKEGEDLKVRPRLRHRADGVLDLTFDDLEFDIERDGDFEMSMLPEEITELKGKSIILRGFILDASVFSNKFDKFVFVRDNNECCFGPGAFLYHNTQVELVEGTFATFTTRPVVVEGTFDIRPFYGPGNKCFSVYHITANKVTER